MPSLPVPSARLTDVARSQVLATKVLSLAGTKPRSVLFAYMLVACFASMWISNVAAPVLCYSLIQVRRIVRPDHLHCGSKN